MKADLHSWEFLGIPRNSQEFLGIPRKLGIHFAREQLKHQPLSRCNRHVIQFVSHIGAIYTGTKKMTQTAPFKRAMSYLR